MSRNPRRPMLVVLVPLEGEPEVIVGADRLEDELRLRAWLRARPDVVAGLGERVLRDLDLLDDRRAA